VIIAATILLSVTTDDETARQGQATDSGRHRVIAPRIDRRAITSGGITRIGAAINDR
jgi:hypothetical protein